MTKMKKLKRYKVEKNLYLFEDTLVLFQQQVSHLFLLVLLVASISMPNLEDL